MHATKLVNKKLLIFFKKYKHLKMCIASSLGENIFISNEKILSTPALKGTGVLKNSTKKVYRWWKAKDFRVTVFSNGSSGKSFAGFDTYFVLMEQLASPSNKWSTLRKLS